MMDKMKVFISQRMNMKTEEEILKEREEAIERLKETRPNIEFEFIDSYFTDPAPDGVNEGAYYMAKSIELMATADLVFFINDWAEASGCNIEYGICKTYGIPVFCE